MKKNILFILFVSMLLPTCCIASYITMATNFSIEENDRGLTLVVISKNRGDEPAYDIQHEIHAGSQTFIGSSVSRLGVNNEIRQEFPIDDAFEQPGHYPVIIKTHYKDANAYPFSALAAGFYDYKTPALSGVLIRADNLKIPSNGKGVIEFTVRNRDSVAHELNLVLHLPNELAVLDEVQQRSVAPKATEILRYTVENFSALVNSSYAVVLIAEYEEEGTHFSTAGSVLVQVTVPPTVSKEMLWILLAFGALAIVLLAVVRIRRSRSRR